MMMKIAILDDYQNVALRMADWSALAKKAEITIFAAAQEHGISIMATGYQSSPTIELTWALILGSARHVVQESHAVRNGGWQTAIGTGLNGKILGVLGLGNIGGPVARIGLALGMRSHRVEPEHDARSRERGWRNTGNEELIVSTSGRPDHPSRVEQAHIRARRRKRVGADETERRPDQHVTSSDRR